MDLEKQQQNENLKLPLLIHSGPSSAAANHTSVLGKVHTFIESRSYYWLLFIGVLVNLVGFILTTNEEPPSDEVVEWMEWVDTLSAGWFLVDWLARIATAPYRGSGRLAYVFFDGYAYVDLIAFLPYFIDLLIFKRDVLIATEWMKVLRLFYPLQQRYLGFNFFDKIFVEQRSLLLTSGFCGFTVWIICSALYYYFEHDNDEMIYCPHGEGHRETCYNRFQSIPGAMYFSLLNFFGEYPLIDHHRGGGRFIGGFIQVVGAAVVAIPAGVFGSAFEEVVQKTASKEDADADDDEAGDVASYGIIGILDGRRGIGRVNLPFMTIDAGYLWHQLTKYLAVISVAHCVFLTFPFPAPLFRWALDFLYAGYVIGAIVFFIEWVFRVNDVMNNARSTYSLYGSYAIIDLLAWAPSFVLVISPHNVFLQMLRVCVIFKLERFQKAFTKFDNILRASGAIFVVTGYVAFAAWLFFSTAIYYAERDNPDEDMRKYYTSVFTSMWMTLLNLTGESPLSDYSTVGRWITGIMGLVAVGFVTIPMGVLGNGFADWLDEGKEDDVAAPDLDDAAAARASIIAQKKDAPTGSTTVTDVKVMSRPSQVQPKWTRADTFLSPQERVFRFLQGNRVRNPSNFALYFERLVFMCIGLCCLLAILETVEDFVAPHSWTESVFTSINFCSVGVFTVEYVLRYYAAPIDPYYKEQGFVSASAARLRYVTSPMAIVDLLAILPYYLACAGSTIADRYDGELRMMRVLRLITLDAYVPSVSLIGRVVRRNAEVLRLACYASVSLWLVFTGLLYMTEHDDSEKVDGIPMGARYHTILQALPYTLVHLTGDYPLVDYTLGAKAVLAVSMLVAVGVVSVPAGILASGYTSELRLFRQEQREMKKNAATVIEKAVHSHIMRRRMRKVISVAVDTERENERLAKNAERENKSIYRAHLFLEKETRAGQLFAMIIVFFIITNVIMVLLESMKPTPFHQHVFEVFEMVSVFVFTTDYLIRLWTAAVNKTYGCSRPLYAFSFMGIIDLVTVLPWWIEMVCMIVFDITFNSFIFRIFRLFRILQLEKFVQAFSVLSDVWFAAKGSLVSTLFIAVLVWIIGSCLFYRCEKDNERMEGAFKDLPSAMYYSVIFLGGEWGKIDFTPAGHLVCMFYCLAGIAVFSLPVGSVFEAFGDALAGDDDDDDDDEKEE
eukprot:GEMP01001399.1.p1 GENE.GEMP01001399.1~~GEMP01001399.1.p1  ORF type:complete len:1177 (+),score=258.16 GEMP01001399.1:112-3642(+)